MEQIKTLTVEMDEIMNIKTLQAQKIVKLQAELDQKNAPSKLNKQNISKFLH